MHADAWIFADRRDAGRKLAAALGAYAHRDALVLALPRGGVPVAYEVAQALDAELDVLLVRKIGAPGQDELALGAVVDGRTPAVVFNDDIVQALAPTAEFMVAAHERALAELARRRLLYQGGRPAPALRGRVVIIVDDGIATGATMKAALKGAIQGGPAKLVLAVPVAPKETLSELARLCDDVVCLAQPEPFLAVGRSYGDFSQTSDREVIELLATGSPAGGESER